MARLRTSGESLSFSFRTQFESGLIQLSSVTVLSWMRCFAITAGRSKEAGRPMACIDPCPGAPIGIFQNSSVVFASATELSPVQCQCPKTVVA